MSDEFICPICLNVMIEPVTLPCSHGLCNACLENTLNEAAMLCPICRYRLSVWVRRNRKKGSLINQEKWQKIKELFSNYVTEKMSGNISAELTEEEQNIIQPTSRKDHVVRPLAAPGELKREYELELQRIREAEAMQERESLELIRQLEMEEQELSSVRQTICERDAALAAELQEELRREDGAAIATSTPSAKRPRLDAPGVGGRQSSTPSWLDRFMAEKRRLSGQLVGGRSSSVDSIGPELRPPPFRPIETFPRSPTKPAQRLETRDEWPLLRPRVQPSEASKENVCLEPSTSASPVATRARRAMLAATSSGAKTAHSLRKKARLRMKNASRRVLATSETTAFSPVCGQRPDRSILDFTERKRKHNPDCQTESSAPGAASKTATDLEASDWQFAQELQRRFDVEYRYSLNSIRIPGEDDAYFFRHRPAKKA